MSVKQSTAIGIGSLFVQVRPNRPVKHTSYLNEIEKNDRVKCCAMPITFTTKVLATQIFRLTAFEAYLYHTIVVAKKLLHYKEKCVHFNKKILSFRILKMLMSS